MLVNKSIYNNCTDCFSHSIKFGTQSTLQNYCSRNSFLLPLILEKLTMKKSDKADTHSTTSTTPSSHTMTQVSPDPIFQMLTGFWVSKTLMTAVELEAFTKLSGNKTVNINEFQNMLGMQQRPAEVFATALVSLGLLNMNVTKNKEAKGEV